MFKIQFKTENELDFLVLENPIKKSKATISLKEGARVSELQLNEKSLIKEQPNFDYQDSYASAILFPFASRIENGAYVFKGEKYQLECNQNGINALHGLVYNKNFQFFEQHVTASECAVTLRYYEKKTCPGFPYQYDFYVTYVLSEHNFSIQVSVKNEDSKAFPFTLGWHPYFFSDNLQSNIVHFQSDKKVVFDENLITKKVVETQSAPNFQIGNQQLDDCFLLQSGNVQFETSDYKFELSSDKQIEYLQMYTPKDLPLIAIEPMTGISNSFNNKIGLQVLEPKQSYAITWNLKLIP